MFILGAFLDMLFLRLVASLSERKKVTMFWRTGDLDREVLLAIVACVEAQLVSEQEMTVTRRKPSYVTGERRRDKKVACLEASQHCLSYSTEILL